MTENAILLPYNVFRMVYVLTFLTVIVFVYDEINAQPVGGLRTRRNANRDWNLLWPAGVIPYEVDEAFTKMDKWVIETAMKDIESVSCIRFKEHKKEKAFIQVVRGNRCTAIVGYIGGPSRVTLSSMCIFTHLITHELMHVLGFYHEHTRPDRDEYITINEDQIKPGIEPFFSKMKDNDVTTFGLPYDYGSIMHYTGRAFAIGYKNTIDPKSKGTEMGHAQKLSPLDILKLNKLYRCPKQKYLLEEGSGGSGDAALEGNLILVST